MSATPFLLASADRARFRSEGEELLSDFRQRRALEESERAEQRRSDCAQQHSAMNSADMRIRAWEKVHQLRMPSDPTHPALAAIAVATQLTLEEIQNEQRLRAVKRASAKA
jgi:hypothetical protein